MRCERGDELAAKETRTAEEEVELGELRATREADLRAWAKCKRAKGGDHGEHEAKEEVETAEAVAAAAQTEGEKAAAAATLQRAHATLDRASKAKAKCKRKRSEGGAHPLERLCVPPPAHTPGPRRHHAQRWQWRLP